MSVETLWSLSVWDMSYEQRDAHFAEYIRLAEAAGAGPEVREMVAAYRKKLECGAILRRADGTESETMQGIPSHPKYYMQPNDDGTCTCFRDSGERRNGWWIFVEGGPS